MITIGTDQLRIEVNESNGLICGLYTPFGTYNLADSAGFGAVSYTLKGDDITTDENFMPYADKLASYDQIFAKEHSITCHNSEFGIDTTYTIDSNRLLIQSCGTDDRLAQFGIDFNLNFLTKINGTDDGQLLPSSPYTSLDCTKMYCIMPTIECGFTIIAATTPCKAWKTIYKNQIKTFQLLSSLPDYFDDETNPHISIEMCFAKTIEECYEKIQKIYDCPMLCPNVTGTFASYIDVDILGNADYVMVSSEHGEKKLPVTGHSVRIFSDGYGKYQITPYKNDVAGLDTVIWFGENSDLLFKKSCDSIKKPYHGDYNLCEGMVWCWSLICYMRSYNTTTYLPVVEDALKTVMGETDSFVPRNTIVPFALDKYPAYHIHQSIRIQEQFFGISILLEMFKLTNKQSYLDFAVHAAETIVNTYQKETGAFETFSGEDYTTVCAPMIPLVDLTLALKDLQRDKEADYFAQSAKKAAEHLVKRGLRFPTEGGIKGVTNEVMEDGSISCTALSLLYYCRYIECVPSYIDFSKKVLEFHDWWRSYTPDVRIYMSTMRWWETKWEGDGTGCAICCGHAWSIWRAEADFHMAVLTKDPNYFMQSWNGFMTNFSKINNSGESYACYQPDYFPGGGLEGIRRSLLQLSEEDLKKRYEIVHDYPRHPDNSLSRYVWVRFCATWQHTAVIMKNDTRTVCLNCELEDTTIKKNAFIEQTYLFDTQNNCDIIS